MTCPKCNKNIPEDGIFCPFCGDKITPIKCNVCNNIIPCDSEFCPYCGRRIKADGEIKSYHNEPKLSDFSGLKSKLKNFADKINPTFAFDSEKRKKKNSFDNIKVQGNKGNASSEGNIKLLIFFCSTTIIMVVLFLVTYLVDYVPNNTYGYYSTSDYFHDFLLNTTTFWIPLINMICCFVSVSRVNHRRMSCLGKSSTKQNVEYIIASLIIGIAGACLIGYPLISIFDLLNCALDVFISCWSSYMFLIFSFAFFLHARKQSADNASEKSKNI